jgi:hypothetical protein
MDDVGRDEMAYSVERRLERAKEIADPLGRGLVLDKLLDDVDELRARIVDQRSIAIFDANLGGVGLNQLAEAFDKSKSLMQQQVVAGRKLVDEADDD